MTENYAANIDRFTGWAALYDQYRAGPPAGLAALLGRYAGVDSARLVVDLGSGTGLSTRYWSDKAGRVIGIEPTADMRRQAEAMSCPDNLEYREGFSHATGLPDGCADIVCCVQAFHWMEPDATFREAARILRPGGVFAACDYDWPPSVGSAPAEAAFDAASGIAQGFESSLGLRNGLRHWDKNGHLERMKHSGCFRHAREVLLTHEDLGNAERFVGLLLTQGQVQQALRHGVPETRLSLPAMRHAAETHLGPILQPWHWSARIRLGVVSAG